jgi:hypothetical protein
MATYFGYVEREADSYVNWADVGRNMSATIDNIQRVRDEKKALIEKAYREDLDFIQANPSGQHETINGWSLNFGNTSAENLKLKYSQLKQGKITVNDFVTFRQNLTDSVEKIYGVTGRLQEIYKDVEERTKNKENQLIERETKVLLEKYGQLENTLPYVNGLTGSVAIGLTDIVEEDGKKVRKLRQGEGSYLTPNQLQAAAEEKFNNYDEQPALDKWVEGLGDVQQDIRSLGGVSVAGLITSVSDVTYDNIIAIINSMPEDKRPAKPIIDAITKYAQDFEEAENLFIDGILAKDTDASAILTEKIGIDPKTGKPYTVVWDKKDATSSDKLYVEKSSDGSGRFIPVFDVNATKDEEKYQMNALKNYLKSQLRVKYDRTAKMNPYTEPTPPVVRGASGYNATVAQGQQNYKEYVDKLALLFTGTPDQKKTAFNFVTTSKDVDQGRTKYTYDPETKTGKLEVWSSDATKNKPYVYEFGKTNVPLDDAVFSLMQMAFPKVQEQYGGYLQNIDLNKPINMNVPLEDAIKEAQKKYDQASVAKSFGFITQAQLDMTKKQLDDLQAMQKSGGTTGKFNK